MCLRHETAVLLLAHPSASAMASGDGGGFSTAWNNSVRSRLYLRRPKSEDAEAIADRRVLEVRKANYGPSGGNLSPGK
jgi:RecA-family ATPase